MIISLSVVRTTSTEAIAAARGDDSNALHGDDHDDSYGGDVFHGDDHDVFHGDVDRNRVDNYGGRVEQKPESKYSGFPKSPNPPELP